MIECWLTHIDGSIHAVVQFVVKKTRLELSQSNYLPNLK